MSYWEIVNENEIPSSPSSDWELVNEMPVTQPQSNRLNASDFAKGSDIIRDLLYGWGKAGANIAKVFNKNAPDMPDIRGAGSNSMAVDIGNYLPFALSGGTGFLGSVLGGAAHGATQFEPGQQGYIDSKLGIKSNRLTNTIEDALLASPISSGKVFSKVKAPALEVPSPALSENISQELMRNISGNNNFEQSGKQLASDIKNSYDKEVAKHEVRYKNIFDYPTENESIFTGEPLKVKEMPMYGKDYIDNYKNYEFPDKDIQLLHDKYISYPSIESAHKLQSEMGKEIGYLKKQNQKSLLDQAGKNKLKDYNNAQKSLKNSMESTLEDINPQLAQEYKNVTESWKNNVVPFHSDKDLKMIAEGKIKNPTSSQVISIFKNPEESMNTIVNKLPETSKDNIIHIGMGKDIYENAPNDLLRGRKSLESKGLASYISPENDQLFANIRSNLQKEKEEKKLFDEKTKTLEENKKVQAKKLDAIKKTLLTLGAGGGLALGGNYLLNAALKNALSNNSEP